MLSYTKIPSSWLSLATHPDLTPDALFVLFCVAHFTLQGKVARFSYFALQNWGLPRRAINGALKLLEAQQLITIDRSGKCNTYQLTAHLDDGRAHLLTNVLFEQRLDPTEKLLLWALDNNAKLTRSKLLAMTGMSKSRLYRLLPSRASTPDSLIARGFLRRTDQGFEVTEPESGDSPTPGTRAKQQSRARQKQRLIAILKLDVDTLNQQGMNDAQKN